MQKKLQKNCKMGRSNKYVATGKNSWNIALQPEQQQQL